MKLLLVKQKKEFSFVTQECDNLSLINKNKNGGWGITSYHSLLVPCSQMPRKRGDV